MIDLLAIQKMIDMEKRKEIVENHRFKISHNKDGFWRTRYIDTNGDRLQIKKRTYEEVCDELVRLTRKDELNPTVREVFVEWNDHRLEIKKIVKSTHAKNRRVFKKMFPEDFQKRRIGNISELEWSDFMESRAVDVPQKMYYNFRTICRGMLMRAKKRKLINLEVGRLMSEIDISDNTFIKNYTPSEDKVFTEDEFPVLMDYLMRHTDDLRCLGVMLILVTGVRVGELCSLKKSDFIDCQTFKVQRTESRWDDENGKTYFEVADRTKTRAGTRVVVIPDKYAFIYDEICALSSNGEWLFEKNNKRMGSDSFRRMFYKICDEFGWVWKSPHDGRRTYISILLDNGVDSNFLLRQVGHTDITTSETYYHEDRKNLSHKKAIVSSIDEFS